MRNTDINRFSEETPSVSGAVVAKSVAKRVLSAVLKIVSTVFLVAFITCLIIGVSMIFYLIDLSNEPLNIDLRQIKSSQTSYVYYTDENGEEQEYLSLYSSSNSIWVDYNDIPKAMKDAIVAIEDKRFYDHNGVDWIRTGGAILHLASDGASYGGSTLTQQLIKNITDDDDVSLTRKLREIFRALNLEKEYTKDEILEAYLNIAHFGSGCDGVQAAADLYFNKEIKDCSIAECAAIAGITQNPYAYTPLVYPEKNKERREVVIQAMYDQEKITEEEYNQAMKESETMTFVGYTYQEDDDERSDWNWYMDHLFREVVADLQESLNIRSDVAEKMIYSGGLRIYSAMDMKAQKLAEEKMLEMKVDDEDLEAAFIMIGFDGRLLATVGSRLPKEGRLLLDRASNVPLQPGSTIKPITSYALAIDKGLINYSSLIPDEPVESWFATGASGPNNWYNKYYGNITVTRALNISSNAAAVQVMNMVGLSKSYEFVTEKLGWRHLDEEQDAKNLGGLSIGGLHGGATLEELTSAYAMFCNGGYCYDTYSYFYVTDSSGNVILDNRDIARPSRAISQDSASIMNRLLSQVVNGGGEALGYRDIIEGWDIIGKTGTTDSSYDNWFVGASPYAAAACWTGYDTSKAITSGDQYKNAYLWHDIMEEWLKGKAHIDYKLSDNVVAAQYCTVSGMLSNGSCSNTATGYYSKDNMPGTCTYCYNSHIPDNDDDDDNGNNGDDNNGENGSNNENSSENGNNDTPPDEESTGGGDVPDTPAEPPTDEGGDVSPPDGGDIVAGNT
ncbi:MAG: transglycosylase domain-containing protein [Acutalibacteraceae bacterium]